jgi:restriction endonuclease S subunit
MKLGDICEIYSGTLLNKENLIDGPYNVIGGGKYIGQHNEFNRQPNEIIISRVGDVIVSFQSSTYYLTDNGFAIVSKSDNLTKYIYYIIKNDEALPKMYSGVAQKVISKTNLLNLEIHIPSLERQLEIVSECAEIEEHIKILEKKILKNAVDAKTYLHQCLK